MTAKYIFGQQFCTIIKKSLNFKGFSHFYNIKNKFVRKIFVRPYSVRGIEFAGKSDDKTNIVGLVLNIINIFIFILFEVLLFMPDFLCNKYYFSFVVGMRPRNYTHFGFELHSLNEIVSAEASRAFAVATALVLFVCFCDII